ncbi:hypothetical protein FS749_007348 [Ceratobasidium sp. UAMH 11750]|nr:hypothetical protein FS749_007348 [Ceratobasidium sp. UAMH 11750]
MSSSVAPRRAVKLRIHVGRAKDEYCHGCSDGGDIVECNLCTRSWCFDYEGDKRNESVPCVTLPIEYMTDEYRIFTCPTCLSSKPEWPLYYTINRGARSTRRRSIKSDVLMFMWYLPRHRVEAELLLSMIGNSLGVYEIVCHSYLTPMPYRFRTAEVVAASSQGDPFHLVGVLVTEANVGGGWWFEDAAGDGPGKQCSEADLLENFTKSLEPAMKTAQSSRLFVVSCGINLSEPKVVPSICEAVKASNWSSVLLPYAPTVTLDAYGPLLPDLVVQLYYMKAPFESALLLSWLKNRQCRVHTDLLTIETGEAPTCKLYAYAPISQRPLGVDLPIAITLCRCPDEACRWNKVRAPKETRGEQVFLFKSQCGRVILHVAVYARALAIREAHGVTFTVQTAGPDKWELPFDPRTMVTMKPQLAITSPSNPLIEYSFPWTVAAANSLQA